MERRERERQQVLCPAKRQKEYEDEEVLGKTRCFSNDLYSQLQQQQLLCLFLCLKNRICFIKIKFLLKKQYQQNNY